MSIITKKHYYQWVLGTLSDYVSEPIADKLSQEIIEFGEKHNLLKEPPVMDVLINNLQDLESAKIFNFIPKSNHSFKSKHFCEFINGIDVDGVTQVTYGIKGNNAYSL